MLNWINQKDAMTSLHDDFAQVGMRLILTKKRIKNINFRVKLGEFLVSYPVHISEHRLIAMIRARFDWAVSAHQKLIQANEQKPTAMHYLWGEPFDLAMWLASHQHQIHARTFRRLTTLVPDDCKAWIDRYELANYIDEILAKWQAKVGKSASHISIKSMSSRWGSCNVRTAKIALSTHLVSYPKACTDYVLVHELCHLIHANHSREFWASVETAMPDYQTWHRMLKGRV